MRFQNKHTPKFTLVYKSICFPSSMGTSKICFFLLQSCSSTGRLSEYLVSFTGCYPNDTIVIDNPGGYVWYRADNNETACNVTLSASDQFIVTGCEKVGGTVAI